MSTKKRKLCSFCGHRRMCQLTVLAGPARRRVYVCRECLAWKDRIQNPAPPKKRRKR